MISKDKRLTRDLFKILSLLRNARHSSFFVMKEILSEEKNSRIGVSVSKKVSKKAVIRNRIRRRVYGALPALPKPSRNILIIAKAGALRLKGDELRRELAELMKRR